MTYIGTLLAGLVLGVAVLGAAIEEDWTCDKMVDGVCYTCALEGYVVDEFVVERDQVVTCTCTPLCESASCLTRAALILPCIVSDGVGGDDE